MFGEQEGPKAVDLEGLKGLAVVDLRGGFLGV